MRISDRYWISLVDPRGRPTVTAGSDNYFCTCCLSVRPSVPTFQNLAKQNKENNDHYWRDCGSGRVDHWWHPCLVFLIFHRLSSWFYLFFTFTLEKSSWHFRLMTYIVALHWLRKTLVPNWIFAVRESDLSSWKEKNSSMLNTNCLLLSRKSTGLY